MKIILIEDVLNLGKKGELKDVAPGYARNHLIPHKLAVEATAQRMKEWEKNREQLEEQHRLEEEEAQKQAAALAELELVFDMPSGEGGRLFGSVTPSDVAEKLAEHKFKIDKKKIEIAEPIKSLGNHIILVRLYPGVKTDLKVKVKSAE